MLTDEQVAVIQARVERHREWHRWDTDDAVDAFLDREALFDERTALVRVADALKRYRALQSESANVGLSATIRLEAEGRARRTLGDAIRAVAALGDGA